jgi:hypothetical protein
MEATIEHKPEIALPRAPRRADNRMNAGEFLCNAEAPCF